MFSFDIDMLFSASLVKSAQKTALLEFQPILIVKATFMGEPTPNFTLFKNRTWTLKNNGQ